MHIHVEFESQLSYESEYPDQTIHTHTIQFHCKNCEHSNQACNYKCEKHHAHHVGIERQIEYKLIDENQTKNNHQFKPKIQATLH